MIREKSVRCEKHARCDTCMGYFVLFMLLHETDFSCLAPRVLNRLVVEAVIMHEAKGFSRVIRDKI